MSNGGSSFVRRPMPTAISAATLGAISAADAQSRLAHVPAESNHVDEPPPEETRHRGWGRTTDKPLSRAAKKRRAKAQKAGRKANTRKGRHGKAR